MAKVNKKLTLTLYILTIAMPLKMAYTKNIESETHNFLEETKMTNITIKTTIQQLEDLFKVFNEKYFESELTKPVITVSPDTTKGAYGWCTGWKAWKETGHEESGHYEINICAEHLSRPYEEVAGTMLHEMVHLYNLENEIKDTSRAGTYHNKKFKEAAEKHGLVVTKIEKYGWARTTLTEEALQIVEEFMNCLENKRFDLYRESPKKAAKKESKSNSRKYVCPCCGLIIRATKEVKVKCLDCDRLLMEEQSNKPRRSNL